MSQVITINLDNGAVVCAVKSEYYPVGTIATVYGRVDDLFIPHPRGGGAQIWDRIADWELVVDAPAQPLMWIKTRDHQPTSFDADSMGRVLVWNEISGFVHLLHVDYIHDLPMAYTHWMPLPGAPA